MSHKLDEYAENCISEFSRMSPSERMIAIQMFINAGLRVTALDFVSSAIAGNQNLTDCVSIENAYYQDLSEIAEGMMDEMLEVIEGVVKGQPLEETVTRPMGKITEDGSAEKTYDLECSAEEYGKYLLGRSSSDLKRVRQEASELVQEYFEERGIDSWKLYSKEAFSVLREAYLSKKDTTQRLERIFRQVSIEVPS